MIAAEKKSKESNNITNITSCSSVEEFGARSE